jgi:hypothetical protein
MTAQKARLADLTEGRAFAENARPGRSRRSAGGLWGRVALVAKLAALYLAVFLACGGWLALVAAPRALICIVGIASVVGAVGCLNGICRCGAAAKPGMRR